MRSSMARSIRRRAPVNGLPGGHTPREIGNRCAPIAAGVTIDLYKILERLHDLGTFKPAGRFTDPSVPFGMSSPKLPLTVTRPALVGCLDCRWLPSVFTRVHPSPSSNRMTSRTFT